MTSAAEWPQDDSLPNIVSSNGLFDGDLLGDELIDIYGTADKSLVKSSADDMPHISDGFAADDGLGAFRPSTSFNDLTSLLSSTDNDAPSDADAVISMLSTSTKSSSTSSAPPKSNLSLPVASTDAPRSSSSASTGMTATAGVPPSNGKKRDAPATASATTPPKRQASISRNVSVGTTLSAKGASLPTADSTGSLVSNDVVPTVSPSVRGAVVPAAVIRPSADTVGKLPTLPSIPTRTTAQSGVSAVLSPSKSSSAATVPSQPVRVVASAKPVVAATAVVPVRKAATDAAQSAATSSSSSSSASATEADFKSVAQAAVSNLIVSAGSAKVEQPKAATQKTTAAHASASASVAAPPAQPKVNVSTDHIKALTGNNWVSVCGGGNTDTTQSTSAAEKANNRARRQNLTPDERARQNRDRNREHARNTRLRKKAYVEELKRTLIELVNQRDAAELESRQSAQRELEQREVRFRVIEEFLKLHGRNEGNAARWAAILDDAFTLSLPLTDFRKMVPTGQPHRGLDQRLTGVNEVMADSTYCASFLQTLGTKASDTIVSIVYHCDRKNFFMDNCNAVLEWTATTSGAVARGATSELSIKGSIKASFSPASNKLLSASILFDTGIVMSQLNHVTSTPKSTDDEVTAAQHAANEADAILDSLQMPHIDTAVPINVTVVPESSCSEASSVKEECSDDE